MEDNILDSFNVAFRDVRNDLESLRALTENIRKTFAVTFFFFALIIFAILSKC